ncbi:hypothetical protein [Streptomyces sp. NPDC059371]|uniref:hypothetical protein n=1 Tax=Streptomyces sp. NPDC059371 TaxID=3346812 RepID=UPI0036D186C9
MAPLFGGQADLLLSAEEVAPTVWKICMTNIAPLGVFGTIASQSAFSENANELRQRVGAIPKEERARIVEYLRSGTPIIALMGFSEDVLGNKFSRPGGTAIMSDGRFFWRLDAADYVQHYGIELPEEFIAHGDARQWAPTALSREEVAQVDRHLGHLRKTGAL